MITNYLEKLIADGEAQYRTHVHAISGIGVIDVPEGTHVIITDFTYFPFADPEEEEDGFDAQEFINRSVHQVEFQSKTSKNNFIIRDTLQLSANNQSFPPPGGMRIDAIPNFGPPIKFDTYLVHGNDIRLRIGTVQLPAPQIGILAGPVFGEPPFPNGYGLDPAIIAVQGTGSNLSFYTPQGQDVAKESGFPIQTGQAVTDQLRIPYVDFAGFESELKFLLNFNQTPLANRTYPIINIGMVQINRTITTTTPASE